MYIYLKSVSLHAWQPQIIYKKQSKNPFCSTRCDMGVQVVQEETQCAARSDLP